MNRKSHLKHYCPFRWLLYISIGQQPWSVCHFSDSHDKIYFLFIGLGFSLGSPIEIFIWKEDSSHSFVRKKSPFVYVIYFIAANCKHIQGPCWGKEANFCQRQTDLDNLFIINCVNSFFFIVNFLLGSMSLCSKVSIENFLSVTQSYQAFLSVIIFVYSTLSFQMHQGIFASWKHILSRIRLGLKFIGDRRLLPLGYNFIVQNIASLFL